MFIGLDLKLATAADFLVWNWPREVKGHQTLRLTHGLARILP